jgi:hypothetical protein
MKHDPGEFASPEPRIEPLEAREFVHDRVRQESAYALLLNTALEAAHRFRRGPGFLRARRRGALRDEQQRADAFITILCGIRERELGCLSLGMGPHW